MKVSLERPRYPLALLCGNALSCAMKKAMPSPLSLLCVIIWKEKDVSKETMAPELSRNRTGCLETTRAALGLRLGLVSGFGVSVTVFLLSRVGVAPEYPSPLGTMEMSKLEKKSSESVSK